MIPEFAWLPPEINSARIFAGAGSGPLRTAASAWASLAADLRASAASFDSVVSGLAAGPWSGPASVLMAAATPYVGWLSRAAGEAESAAVQARAAATVFEAALSATVHPAAVTANRVSLLSLVATNYLGQNTPAIAAAEGDYLEMWAQDVAAMVGYHAGATSVASTLTPFSLPPLTMAGLVGLASQVASGVRAIASSAGAAIATPVQGIVSAAPSALSMLQSVPLSSLMYPVSMAISPLMSAVTNAARTPAAGLAGATAGGAAAGEPKFVGAAHPGTKPFGGGGLGSATSAGLGKARMVGTMSVPPTWQGSTPTRMASSPLSGLGAAGMPNPAELTGAARPAGMPMMPMPMGGAGAGMPGAMMGRGGAAGNPVQSRPSVIPRTGIG
ncbi:PPE family protein [Mycobacterium ostraviense]|uniref:PPE family protein n=1 Tax=Mycobacterium ostraviense TaxID=2738409 RepID=A0A164BN55_9MYCO|nr:PPE family protein [Mycobacterium ostraviense]KZS63662.1 hypothetical protein A4G28_07430 [Mycobacterium ostraviense]UGT92509.1 PPE family protein [Mycobacterium ostraviense]